MIALHGRLAAWRGRPPWGQIVAVGVRLIDLPSRYAFHLLVAAQLGVAAAGGFYIAFSATMLAASCGRLGIDRALTRAVARAIERGDPAGARAAIARSFRIVVSLSLATMAAMLALAWPLAHLLLHKPDLTVPLILGTATVLPLAIGVVAGGALAGLHRLGLSLMVYSWLWPALFCAGALVVPLDLSRALLLIAGATGVNAAIAAVLLHRCLPAAPAAPAPPPPTPADSLVATGFALFSTEVVQLLLGYAPVLVLGMVASDAAVGLYAVAWRLALAINLLVTTIAAIAAPRFAMLYARGDIPALRRTAAQAIGVAVLLSALPAAAMLVMPATLLAMIGPGFAAAAPTLRWLIAGQAVAVCGTATAELLGMTGYAGELRRINLATLAVLAGSLVVLGAAGGAQGAAIATSLTIAVGAVLTSLAVRRHLGFVPVAALLRSRANG